MKSILILRTLILGLLVIVAIGACNKPAGNTGADSNIDYYTCTMHPSVRSKTPGKCPICSMDLVPVYKKSAAANSPAQNTNETVAAQSGERKIKYYQSTMNPKETSPVPAKDSMGMEMKPVFEEDGAGENQPGEFTVPIERQQQIGVTYATVEKKPVTFSVRAVGMVASDTQRHWDYVSRVEGYVQKLFVSSPGA